MKEIEGLGNTELCKCFIASHYKMNKEILDEIFGKTKLDVIICEFDKG